MWLSSAAEARIPGERSRPEPGIETSSRRRQGRELAVCWGELAGRARYSLWSR